MGRGKGKIKIDQSDVDRNDVSVFQGGEMKKKVLSSIMAAMVATSLLAGCGGSAQKADEGKDVPAAATSADAAGGSSDSKTASSSDEIAYNGDEVTITYWHTHSDAEEEVLTDQIIPAFEEKYPKIHVEAVRMPYDGLMQQIITSISSSTGPDLMRMDIIWVPELAKMGALEAVDDLDGFAKLKDTLYEGPLQTNFYDGKYYGLPLNTNCLSGAWSKPLMEQLGIKELPKTYDEVLALKDKLKKGQYLIACEGPNPWSMAPLFSSLGGVYTNEDHTKASGYLDSEASIKAMETIVKWYDEGIIGPCMNGEKPDAANGLYDGQYLFSYQGPWFYSNDDESQIAKVQDGLLPAGEAGSLTVNGGEDLVIFKGSQKKEASWVFARFLMSDFAQKAQAVGGGHLVPTVKTVAESEEVKNTPHMETYLKQLEGAVPRTPTPVWEKMSDKLTVAFTSCLLHEDKPQSAFQKAAKEIDALLAEGGK